MKNTNIEVEGGEILIQSKEGHYAIIPAKHRQEVMDMVKGGCDGCINNYIQTLPKDSDYAEDGSLLPEDKKKITFEHKPYTAVQDNTYVAPKVIPPLEQKKKQQFISREQPVLKADTRTDKQREIDRKYTESVLNPSIGTQIGEMFQKPLRWMADPVKGVGDIVSAVAPNSALAKDLPNTNQDVFEHRKKQLNPYTSSKEKVNNTINEAIPLTNWAMLNTLPIEVAGANMIKRGKNLIKGASKVDDVVKGLSKEKQLAKLDEITDATTNINKFKSEIDWSKWNKEIPNNGQLVKEYNAIEQAHKEIGTWMKNPDGSTFNGTPEQFVQQNSENFKKAFPEGFENVYRGVGHMNVNKELRPERSMFTADKDLASKYTRNKDYLTPFDEFNTLDKSQFNPNVRDGLFNLAHKKSSNSIELDNFGRHWAEIDLTNPKQSIDNINLNIKNLEKQVERQREWLKTGKKNPDGSWSFPNSDIVYADQLYKEGVKGQEKILNSYKDRLKNINQLVKNEPELEKMRKVLGDKSTTDDIAKYIENNNLDYVKIKNVDDSRLGDVSIVNHKKGNYLKSLIGNNGMFDMANPNIYKSLIPLIGYDTYLQSQQSNKTK